MLTKSSLLLHAWECLAKVDIGRSFEGRKGDFQFGKIQ